jgi:ribose transport system substrate-binding protein
MFQPHPRTPRRPRPALRPAALAAAFAAAALIAGCSSASTSGTQATATSSSSPSADVQQAAAQVTQFEQAGSYAPAGAPLSGVRTALAGKTVYYVPIDQQVPIFPVAEAGLSQALGVVGAHLHVCDGSDSPSTTTACLDQAIADGAAAVVTDSIPFGFAEQGFLAVERHHIPILLGDEPSVGAAGTPVAGTDQLAFLETDQNRAMSLSADWIIAHSGGHADVLVIEVTDSPLTVDAITQGALAQFRNLCPGCTVHTITTSTANLSSLPSAVSSALLKDRNIGYVFSEFDTDVQAALGGVVQSGFGSKVIGVSSMGILGSLQMLHSGSFLQEDTGSDGILLGWQYANQVFRMILHQPVLQSEDIPQRVFTRQNVTALQLTSAGQLSGAWYGTTTFKAAFEKLWGVGA